MAESYPRQDQARGIWKTGDITKNIKDNGTYPQLGQGTIGLLNLGTGSYVNTVEKIIVETTGNSTDFGDLAEGRNQNAGISSFIRSIFAGGTTGSVTNTINYIHSQSQGNYSDFGDLTVARRGLGGCGNNTRGLFAGGNTGSNSNVIDFITISALGNASDWGDLTETSMGWNNSQINSQTRGLWAGSNNPGPATNTINSIEFSSIGNVVNFADLSVARSQPSGACSSSRGVFAGGLSPNYNVIDFINILVILLLENNMQVE
jgi:hypothetical protein